DHAAEIDVQCDFTFSPRIIVCALIYLILFGSGLSGLGGSGLLLAGRFSRLYNSQHCRRVPPGIVAAAIGQKEPVFTAQLDSFPDMGF
ncbi:MAG: hypothetical protein GY950_31175, partial [bacterium]|nr:hypothetical protein [bacterium]